MTTNSTSLPPLNGLILSGGKSSRMGRDKGLLTYHQAPQITHLTNLLNPFCGQVFISTKHETDYPNHSVIADQYLIESPLNGILSALKLYPKNAWLIIACDMPFIDPESIDHLIQNRSVKNLTTCYRNKGNQTEPLFCIWEPSVFTLLNDFQLRGEVSPKKFLENNNTQFVTPTNFQSLINVNTLKDYKKINTNN